MKISSRYTEVVCDTMVKQTDDGLFFAKNSDRDPNEAQIIEWHAGKTHSENSTVKTTYLEIPQVRQTYSTIISRPWWMFGAEMGTNEHGLTIGNEAVFTKIEMGDGPGLLGMDMLRLALERDKTAESAIETIVTLLETYGQDGSSSYEHPDFKYHNSFLIADPNNAFVLETAGKHYAVERVTTQARSISNCLSIRGFANRFHSHRKSYLGTPEKRQSVTLSGMIRAESLLDVMNVLKIHGPEDHPEYSPINGSMVRPNMHAGGLLAHSQTVNSWVSFLSNEPVHYATGSADPAISPFLPIRFDEPLDFGQPTNTVDTDTWWWFSETLHRLTVRNYEESIKIIKPRLTELQEEILKGIGAREAFDKAHHLKQELIDELISRDFSDSRPVWLKRSWRKENRKAQALA